ncbi:MAG: tetratricopeptide repeat protein [Deltaproteobacteria bacterium]|nr:tetratricopeptide repeat protein [Deltaproteobacteria bacterium]
MDSKKFRLFRESFLPVSLVFLGLFLVLLFVQFRAAMDADQVTVIEIEDAPVSQNETDGDGDMETDSSDSGFLTSQTPLTARAEKLIAQKKWEEAEKLYREELAKKPSSELFNDLGMLYRKKKDAHQALKTFGEALKHKPVFLQAYFNRAALLAKLDREKEALDDYRTLIHKNPNHYEAHYNLGVLLIRQKQFPQAVEVFKRAASLAGGSRKAKTLYNLGFVYRKQGDAAKAREAYTQSIRIRPEYLKPRFGLAALEPDSLAGQKKALAYLKDALRLKPGHAPTYFRIGNAQNKLGNPEAAVQAYRKAIQFKPSYRKARYNLGLILVNQEKWKGARTQFDWLAKKDPEDGKVFFNLGRIAYGENKGEESLTHYRKALELTQGNFPEAHLNMGLVYNSLGKYKKAVESYRTAIRQNPRYGLAWYNLGISYEDQKLWKQARKALSAAVKNEPGLDKGWYHLGLVTAREGHAEKAIDPLKKAIQLRREYPEAELQLGIQLEILGRFPEAGEVLDRLVDRDDTYSQAWLHLGHARMGAGQLKDAIRAYRKSLELDPDNPAVYTALSGALVRDGDSAEAVDLMEHAVNIESGNARLRLALGRAYIADGKKSKALEELRKGRILQPENQEIQKELSALESSKP